MKVTSASEDASQIELWLENQVNPSEVFKKISYEEMKEALESWLTPEDSAQEGDIIDDEKEVEEAPKTNYSLNTSVQNVKQNKLDKFDSLFDGEDDGLPF
jgi:hypothetical protein